MSPIHLQAVRVSYHENWLEGMELCLVAKMPGTHEGCDYTRRAFLGEWLGGT